MREVKQAAQDVLHAQLPGPGPERYQVTLHAPAASFVTEVDITPDFNTARRHSHSRCSVCPCRHGT